MSVKEWQDYLRQQSAQIDNDWVLGFQSGASSAGPNALHLCALTHLACIEVCGDDAPSFLQNQMSNDTRLVSDQQAQLAAYCSAKGRVISLLWILKSKQGYFLLLPRDRVDALVKRLRMFVLMSRVDIQDVSDQWHCLGIFGDNCDAVVQRLGVTTRDETLGVGQNDSLCAVRCHGTQARYLLLAAHAQAATLWQTLSAQAECVASKRWIAEDIKAGVPQVYQATTEAFVPQMLNLHSLNAISFTKGCYPGQEVVARMKYLGKLKRRMFHAEVLGDWVIRPGDEIVDTDNKSVGQVVDVAPLPDSSGNRLLAVLLIDASNNPLKIKGYEQSLLKIKDLPYTVEVENS